MHPTYPNRAKQLRERLLAQRSPALEPVIIDGETFHLRAPMISDRDAITKLATGSGFKPTKDGEAPDVPLDRMLVAAAITLACDDTGAPIFEASDFDDLRARPIGSWFEKLAMAALMRLNPKETPTGEAPGGRPESASSTSSPTA